MKHQRTIAPRYEYDDQGYPVRSLGEVEWHYVTQRHNGRLAGLTYFIELDHMDNRKLQAIQLSIARREVRALIGREGG